MVPVPALKCLVVVSQAAVPCTHRECPCAAEMPPSRAMDNVTVRQGERHPQVGEPPSLSESTVICGGMGRARGGRCAPELPQGKASAVGAGLPTLMG